MQKIQPAKNTLDMDFLNAFNKPIGGSAPAETANTQAQEVQSVKKTEAKAEEITEIDTTMSSASEFDEINSEINEETAIDDDVSASKNIKATQIVVRTTEKEREALKSYFMKHGISLSKGIKVAIKYLEQQEKKGLVHFSDIGLY